MRLLLPLALILSVIPSCFGQAGRAELFGTIFDPSTLPVAKANVQAENQATMARYSAASDDRGQYHLLGLPAGDYVLIVEHPGFRKYRQSGITLRLGDQTEINVTLQVGAPTQSVEVVAQAPLLQTASSDVSYQVDQIKVETLPLDGRNFIPLVALAPGVALPGGGSVLPRINGSRPRTNEYLYDGISALQPEPGQVAFFPVIDGIEEFKLNINSYSPEYGRSNGGTIMVIGKSGSNQIHGTVFEFIRNEDLNSAPYNFTSAPVVKPEFRRNQYGFALSGPIQKNKTFFFGDWQGTRLRTGITRISTVPTTAQRNGIFATPIFDPVTRQPIQNNTIQQGLWDPIASQVLSRYPQPTTAATANNYSRTATEPDNQDQFDGRVDHYFTPNHRAFVRYSYLRDDDTPVTPLPDGSGLLSSGVTGHAITRGDGLTGQYEWTISPTMLNQARFGYTRRDLNQASLQNRAQNGGITVPGLPSNTFSSVLPIFTPSGFQQIGPTAGANDTFTTSVKEYLDTFSMVKGRHTFKFGVDIRREALNVVNPPNPTGSFTFNTTGTNGSSVPNSGNAIASLLLGQVNSFIVDVQGRELQERANIFEAFFNDEWKVSSRLTLNLGTRYTLNFPSTEVRGQGSAFNLNTQLLEFPGTGRNVECCDFGPRAGIAYLIGDSWVVRSGYGMVFFEASGITTPFTLPQFPFVQTLTLQSADNVTPAFVLKNGPSIQVTAPNPNSGLGQGVFGTDRDVGSGYSQQWNFTIEKTIGKNLNFEAGYLGSKNTRLGVPDANINQLPDSDLSLSAALLAKVPNPFAGQIPGNPTLNGATVTQQQLLRPFPRFTNVALFRDNIGNSSYDALQMKLEQRLSHNLSFTFAFTFSKLIDDASSVFSNTIFTGPIANTGVADANNKHLERDLSTGDIPRVFTGGWVYRIPRIWKIAGWEIAGLVRVQSGDMVIVSQATNFDANLGFGVQRPNRLSNPNSFAGRGPREWFNIASFTQANQFVIGNSSRNPVRGPGLQDVDMMIGKTFRITERVNFEFRAEAFNMTNTPAFGDPNGSFGSAAFGTITTAGTPRDFEFAGKIHF
jgi:hypothetical protein